MGWEACVALLMPLPPSFAAFSITVGIFKWLLILIGEARRNHCREKVLLLVTTKQGEAPPLPLYYYRSVLALHRSIIVPGVLSAPSLTGTRVLQGIALGAVPNKKNEMDQAFDSRVLQRDMLLRHVALSSELKPTIRVSSEPRLTRLATPVVHLRGGKGKVVLKHTVWRLSTIEPENRPSDSQITVHRSFKYGVAHMSTGKLTVYPRKNASDHVLRHPFRVILSGLDANCTRQIPS
eukprot:3322651-Rhodomonas_salina.1